MNQDAHPICAELKKCGIRYVANLPERWTANLLECLCSDPEFRLISVAKEEEDYVLAFNRNQRLGQEVR